MRKCYMTKKIRTLLLIISCILFCLTVQASESDKVVVDRYWSDSYVWITDEDNTEMEADIYLKNTEEIENIDDQLEIKIETFRIYGYFTDADDIEVKIKDTKTTKYGILLELTICFDEDIDIENGRHKSRIELSIESKDKQIKIKQNEEILKFTLIVDKEETETDTAPYDDNVPFWLYMYPVI